MGEKAANVEDCARPTASSSLETASLAHIVGHQHMNVFLLHPAEGHDDRICGSGIIAGNSGRTRLGPVGLYIVSVGYFVAGVLGAIAGWAAMITPALLIIPLVHFVGRKMQHPRVRGVLKTVVLASAGLLLGVPP